MKMYFYFQYVFTIPATNTANNTVHDQLLLHLPSLLNPDNTDFLLINKFLVNSNFFFQIIVKSMGQYLLTSNRIKVNKNVFSLKKNMNDCDFSVLISCNFYFFYTLTLISYMVHKV